MMLMNILRWLMVLAGAVGALASVWALIDPSIMASTSNMLVPPPSPRWRALMALLFSLAILGFGLGVLRHRELP